MGKNIVKLPVDDRPYEKLERLGSENLSNSELLAIIIKTGTKELNCLEVAQNVLTTDKNIDNISDLEHLNNLSIHELMKFPGIGRVKAIQIKAVVELAKRISYSSKNVDKCKINSPKDIFNLVKKSYIGKKQEIIKTVLLDKSNKVICVVTNSLGNIDSVMIGIREIFSEPIKQMAASIILVHNHPSGNTTPSKEDIKFTKMVVQNGEIFQIKVLDHVIIGNNSYSSLVELGYI